MVSKIIYRLSTVKYAFHSYIGYPKLYIGFPQLNMLSSYIGYPKLYIGFPQLNMLFTVI